MRRNPASIPAIANKKSQGGNTAKPKTEKLAPNGAIALPALNPAATHLSELGLHAPDLPPFDPSQFPPLPDEPVVRT